MPSPSAARRAAPLPLEERRAALVAATLPLLREHGAQVRTRDIAASAGVAEGTIFRAFPDKDSLITAAIEAAFDPATVITALGAIDPALPLRARLVEIVRALQRHMTNVVELVAAVGLHRQDDCRQISPSESGAVDVRNSRRDMHARFTPALDAVTRLLKPDAAALRVSPAEATRYLRLLVFAGSHPGLTEGNPLDAEEIVTILLDGLRADSESARERSC